MSKPAGQDAGDGTQQRQRQHALALYQFQPASIGHNRKLIPDILCRV